ncbi:MAG: ABC transporter permease [Kiritimatiellaeota bacterium]|nr:ABC transporter permease [Kiritimatiellota bacterium]
MIQLEHVSKAYRMGAITVQALRDVSLSIVPGEFVALMGASGSGKSTLMHVLGLLDQPTSGAYRLFGRDVAGLSEDEFAILRSRTVGFVFQQFHLLARTSAEENVALPALYSFDPVPAGRAAALLQEIGLGDRRRHKPNELSGGQQQRVAIARSLVNDPQILLADEPTGNLDSASAAEIIGILTALNRQGKTIILVTHEIDLAACARRIIRLRDGCVVSDEVHEPTVAQDGPPDGAGLAARRPTGAPARALAGAQRLPNRAERLRSSLRRTGPLLRQAFRSVAAAKVRSALSMLGILIGVAAIIAMLALGTGAKEAMRQSLSSLGSNLLVLMPGTVQVRGVTQAAGDTTRLTLEDLQGLRVAESAIVRLAPSVGGRAQAVYRSANCNTQVLGTTPEYQAMRSWALRGGRFFTTNEVTQRARVAVVGATVARELFSGANAVGEYIKINKVSFQVLGLLTPKGDSGFRDQDDVIIIPVTTAMYRLLGKQYLDSISLEAASADVIPVLQERVLAVMKRMHHLPPSQEDESYHIHNMAEIQDALMATTRTMSFLLAAIAVISLLVGGIGIMNIMLVSVTERTREIGLRKALGARRREIMNQFLIEALVISVTGGFIGILLGWGISAGLSSLAGWPTSVAPLAVGLAFGFSGLVGIVFGLWPARKAARLNPIEALRYE